MKVSTVVDINVVVSAETDGKGGTTYRIESVEGPSYAGPDLDEVTLDEGMIHWGITRQEKAIEAVRRDLFEHYGVDHGNLSKIDNLAAQVRGWISDRKLFGSRTHDSRQDSRSTREG